MLLKLQIICYLQILNGLWTHSIIIIIVFFFSLSMLMIFPNLVLYCPEAVIQRCSWKRCFENMPKCNCCPCRSVISIKLENNFIEITFRHGCSPVSLLKTPLDGCFWLCLNRLEMNLLSWLWPNYNTRGTNLHSPHYRFRSNRSVVFLNSFMTEAVII